MNGCAPNLNLEKVQRPRLDDSWEECNSRIIADKCYAYIDAYEYDKKKYIQLPDNQETYTINVLDVQWADSTQIVTNCPNKLCGIESPGPFQTLFTAKKRKTDSRYFSLIGEVISDEDNGLQVFDLCESQSINIENNKLNKLRYLTFYPNDAEGFFYDTAQFYHNNSGGIWILITKISN